MTARPPLPARILIPVANPMTAEELIRLGAALLDPRAGELTALGIVEVPEGMPLSEGATRARHARRLLQRVLDYAPGRARRSTRSSGSAATPRRASSRPSAEQEADLIIFGWGGKAPAGRDGSGPTVFSPTIDEVVRDVAVRHRGRQAARRKEIRRILVPVRGGPHAELALRYADAIARHHDATVVVLHLVPPGITLAVRAQAERALAAFIKQHLNGRGEARPPRGAQRPQRDPARGRAGRPRRHGRLGPARRRRRREPTCSARCPRRSPPAPGRPSWSSRPARRSAGTTFEQLAARAETLAAADRAAEEARAVPVRVERWFGESNFHHAEFADLRRLVDAQGEAGR